MTKTLTSDQDFLLSSVSRGNKDPLSLLTVNLGSSDGWGEVVDLVASRRVSLVLLTHTGLNGGVGRREVTWPNYRHLRRDEDCGGLILHFHHTLKVTELVSLRDPNFHGIWLKVTEEIIEGRVTVVGIVDADNLENLVAYISSCVDKARALYGAEVNLILGGSHDLGKPVDCPASLASLTWTSPGQGQFLLHSPRLALEVEMMPDLGEVAVLGTLRPTGCPICDVGFDSELQLTEHRRSAKHRKNWVYNYYLANKVEMLRSPHPLGLDMTVVSADPGVVSNEGVVEITSSPGQVQQFKIQLKNDICTEAGDEDSQVGLVVENVAVPREDEVFRLSDEHNLTGNEDTKIRIRRGKRYKVQVTCSSDQVGHYRVPIIVVFYHDKMSELVEGDSVRKVSHMAVELLLKVQTEEMKNLLPLVPYKPRKKVQPWYAKETVRGNPLPRPIGSADEDNLESKLPLGRYPLSESLGRIVANRFRGEGDTVEERQQIARARDLLEQPIAPEHYTDKFQLLLHCEEWQETRDIRYFDMESVDMKMDTKTGLVMLEVPGLMESRPSLLRGDKLYVRESGKGLKEYEGFIHQVGETVVWIGFSDKLVTQVVRDKKWDVRLSVCLFPLTNMHRAVRMAQTLHLVGPTLFPAVDCLSNMSQTQPNIDCYNPLVQTNPEQYSAVTAIVAGSSGPAPYIVFGPPGTGKTVTLVEAIKQVWKLNPEAHILATAPSNTAADLLSERLAQHIPPGQMLRIHALNRGRQTIPASIDHVSNVSGDAVFFPPMSELIKYNVLVTTLISAGRLVSAQFPTEHFNYVFIDEAGQATEPETCVALAGLITCHSANQSGGKVVMAGDPKQLGPIVRSPVAEEHGLAVSLLERLMKEPLYKRSTTTGYDGRCITKLVRNFRSHSTLLELPSRMFYEAELSACCERQKADSCLLFSGLPPAVTGKIPMVVHGVVGQDMREEMSPSYFNPAEIVTVLDYVSKLLDEGVSAEEIGVITPYRRQVQKIRDRLDQKGMRGVMVGTTEEFQGQEKKAVIVSTVRSSPQYLNTDARYKLGFLTNPKRFNVAITRAKALLIIVGNPHILGQDPCWRELLHHSISIGCYTGCDYSVETDEKAAILETKLSKLVMDHGDLERLEEAGWLPRV